MNRREAFMVAIIIVVGLLMGSIEKESKSKSDKSSDKDKVTIYYDRNPREKKRQRREACCETQVLSHKRLEQQIPPDAELIIVDRHGDLLISSEDGTTLSANVEILAPKDYKYAEKIQV
ncbi:hypothetical protein ACFLU6_12760, partial [Acidobacteriota bacterium]